jgi:hypothetical protein
MHRQEDGYLYVQKQTKDLSAGDCRNLKSACTHARELGRPLNTLVTFAPAPSRRRGSGMLPTWERNFVAEAEGV